ncbi:hypothetical protein EVAR_137_1 [Eumeta japonica]|uniref:Uncharacterized protein n=1 Tax=Eumeta variegata TaxID=151549 RepID=A0A4C1S8F5_EUMVA|nr:hypothetical protein EVAR_137_1 [Eumeta japonica]
MRPEMSNTPRTREGSRIARTPSGRPSVVYRPWRPPRECPAAAKRSRGDSGKTPRRDEHVARGPRRVVNKRNLNGEDRSVSDRDTAGPQDESASAMLNAHSVRRDSAERGSRLARELSN